jgi:hypothetical protein
MPHRGSNLDSRAAIHTTISNHMAALSADRRSVPLRPLLQKRLAPAQSGRAGLQRLFRGAHAAPQHQIRVELYHFGFG